MALEETNAPGATPINQSSNQIKKMFLRKVRCLLLQVFKKRVTKCSDLDKVKKLLFIWKF